ncbi:MAG: Flp pilus assembly protein CpaB [Roseovarius sp.]|nr:Flp pilus assembly protein CpaB [Roseovarius sp.]
MRGTTLISLGIAIVLALIAVFAARGWLSDQRARILAEAVQTDDRTPRDEIVIAAAQLRFGERLTADKLDTIGWPADRMPQGAFTAIPALVGTSDETARFVLESMEEGEPVLRSKITDPGQRAKLSTALTPGMKAVSIRVNDVLGVAGFVLPGDRVDVLLTRSDGNRGEAFVDVLLQGVRVLAIDQIADDRKDQPSVVRTVTFEVTTPEAQKLTLAATVGTLSLALRNAVSTETEAPERITTIDLGEAEIARSLAVEAQRSQVEEEVAALNAQIAGLQEMLREMGAEVTGRLASVEQNIATRERRTPEPETLERVVELVVAPPPPAYATVGVLHGGKRVEYKVKAYAVN